MLPLSEVNIDFAEHCRREDDDKLVWCEDCRSLVSPPCTVHGEFTVVKDRTIPSRAKLSLPHHLAIRCIEMRAANDDVYGVYARKVIQARTQFGPYEGKLTETWSCKREDRIQLKLFFPNGRSLYLDCTDETICNWMMFVRPATTIHEQNLVVFQYRGAVYFVTIRPIAPNEELMVWYAGHYADKLGKALLLDNLKTKQIAETNVNSEVQNDTNNDPFSKEAQDKMIDKDTLAPVENILHITDTSDGALQVDENQGDDVSEDDDDKFVIETEDVTTETPAEVLPVIVCKEEVMSDNELPTEDHEQDLPKLTRPGRRTRNKRKGQPVKLRGKDLKMTIKISSTNCDETESTLYLSDDLEDVKEEPELPPIKRGRGRPKGSKNRKGVKLGGFVRQKLRKARKFFVKEKVKEVKPEIKRRGRKPKEAKQLHICEICGKAFHHSSKLQLHSYIHSGERPFACSEDNCSKTFTSKFKLDRHMLVHNSNKKFACVYCDKSFSRKDHLKNHLKVHDPNKEMFHCEECGKEYASSFAFRTHLSLHAANRGELQCLVCKAMFEMTEDLLHHLKIHSGARSVKDSSEKKHRCSICDKCFFTKKDVARHMVTHTKSRDHMCHFCPQSFGRRDHLARHLKTAHGDEHNEQDNLGKDEKFSLTETLSYDHTKVASMVMQSVDKYIQQESPKKSRGKVAAKQGSPKRNKSNTSVQLQSPVLYDNVASGAHVAPQQSNIANLSQTIDHSFLQQPQVPADRLMSITQIGSMNQILTTNTDLQYSGIKDYSTKNHMNEYVNPQQIIAQPLTITSQPVIQQSPLILNVAKNDMSINAINYGEYMPNVSSAGIDMQDGSLLLPYTADTLGIKLVAQNVMQPPS